MGYFKSVCVLSRKPIQFVGTPYQIFEMMVFVSISRDLDSIEVVGNDYPDLFSPLWKTRPATLCVLSSCILSISSGV